MKRRLYDPYLSHPRASTIRISLLGQPLFPAQRMAADVSPIVLNGSKSLGNLLKHFENIEK